MGVFDQTARRVAKRNGAGFYRWALPRLDPALTFTGWNDTRTAPGAGKKELTLDAVGEFANASRPEEPWLFVVEFKAEPRPDDLEQLAEYMMRCRHDRRPQTDSRLRYLVGGVLFDLTGKRATDTVNMPMPGYPGVGFFFRPEPRSLCDDDATATLAGVAAGRIAACVLPLVPLMRGASEAAVIVEWKRLVDASLAPHERDEYASDARIFADLADLLNVWEPMLKGYNMETSRVVMEWQAEAELRRLRSDLLRALERRCKAPVPADIVQPVQAMTDLNALSRWFDAAIDASTYDDFRAAIKS